MALKMCGIEYGVFSAGMACARLGSFLASTGSSVPERSASYMSTSPSSATSMLPRREFFSARSLVTRPTALPVSYTTLTSCLATMGLMICCSRFW
ncbi:hypothetical protein D3C85_148290 [compost metagenome]